MPRGGDRSAEAKAAGKRMGRPPKAKIELKADSGIATRVLAGIGEEQRWREILRCDLTTEQRLALPLGEKRLIEETLEYHTDRRDGKPAQGVFVGDTREGTAALERGNAPSYFGSSAHAPRNLAGSDKPN